MTVKNIGKFGINIDKKDFDFYKVRLSKQNKMRKFCVKNMKHYEKSKTLFSPPVDVHMKKLCKKKSMDVWLVDGDKVRTFMDIDFTTGGHGVRYLYVPMNEIWIDSATPKNEINYIILHEFVEFNLMAKGMNYNNAHTIASIVESIERQKKNRKLN